MSGGHSGVSATLNNNAVCERQGTCTDSVTTLFSFKFGRFYYFILRFSLSERKLYLLGTICVLKIHLRGAENSAIP